MSQFDSLSPVFRESLRSAIDKIKKADCGCGGIPGDVVQEKPERIMKVLSKIQDFNDRIVKDWLYSLDDQSMAAVEQAFEELAQISAAELIALMLSEGSGTPFELIGKLFGKDANESRAAPTEEAVVVVDEKTLSDEGSEPQSPQLEQ
jgi:hypothetical protein